MTKEELIEKIKKLMALSQSSNPNEAAVALSRAQKLMEAYNIEMRDLGLMGNIKEISIEVPTKLNSKTIASSLGAIIQKCFGIMVISHSRGSKISRLSFIGQSEILESCEYVFVYLSRLAEHAIDNYALTLYYEICCDFISNQHMLSQIIRLTPDFYEQVLTSIIEDKDAYASIIKCIDDPDYGEDAARKLRKINRIILSELKQNPALSTVWNSEVRQRKKSFIFGYFNAISSKVSEYARTSDEDEKVKLFIKEKYANSLKQRKLGRYRLDDAYNAGVEQGEKVRISSAVGADSAPLKALENF